MNFIRVLLTLIRMQANSLVKDFDNKVDSLSLKPFEYNGIFYVHEYNTSVNDSLINDLFNDDLHNCRFCRDRIKKFCRISDKDGPLLLQFFDKPSQILAIKRWCSGNFIPKILDQELLFGYEKELGSYPHIFFPTKYTEKTKNVSLIQYAVNRYIKDGLLEALVRNLILCNDNNPLEVINSLECFIKCCSKATYGETFINTAKWLISIMEGYSKSNNIDLFMKALIDAGIEKDLHGAVITKYHQANDNILSLLRDARTEEAMIKLVENRLNPHNYRRRDSDAILTEGNIDNAMKHLGDFENTIMTHEETAKLPHCITIKGKQENKGSMSAFEQMKSSMKPKGSFASRCSNIDINSISTMESFYEYLEKNPHSDIYIQSYNLEGIYIAKTSIDLDKIITPHMWAFTDAIKRKSGWLKIKYIVPMYKYIESHKNIAFILDSNEILDTSNIKNCCFPAFLKPAYARTCDKAFERINSLKKIQIPSGDISVGLGTSISGSKLVRNVKIKINGIEIEISKP